MTYSNKNKTTLATVAARANVSVITASRAFSQPEKVSPETLKRIQKSAEELGYILNASARNLRAKKSKTIGVVTPDMVNPFFSRLTQIISHEARKRKYDTLIFDTCESQEIEKHIIEKLIGYNVDAIILAVISSDRHYQPPYLHQLKILGIPVVLIDRELDTDYCSGVFIDNFDCGVQAGNWIMKQGVRHVVVVSGPENSNVSYERVMGIQSILQHRIPSLNILQADFFMEMAWNKTKHWLENNAAPDYFIACNNQISQGIIKACIEKSVMQKTSLFSIDMVTYSDVFGFHFPCICHNLHEIALQAIKLVIC
ncbi:LacI family transcriptional regulator, partial [Salmonella enterica subsp. enterica]|nr:LacI family transcriptional regulator [Salmonella enterica subsp. enterica serovar Reading]